MSIKQLTGTIRKLRLISNPICHRLKNKCNTDTSQFSRSKGNQSMKFSHLIEYNMRNNFLEKSYAKFGGKVIPRFFYKNTKLSIFLDQQFERLLHL